MERDLDDDVHDLPVPLDRETRGWLADLARATGKHPRDLIAAMLHDIRTDDERTHALN